MGHSQSYLKITPKFLTKKELLKLYRLEKFTFHSFKNTVWEIGEGGTKFNNDQQLAVHRAAATW
jgi:hypothetical protein